MSAYRLSFLRRKGWLRVGAVGAVIMLPLAAMEHALGFFSEGLLGLRQAAEFVAGGAAIWLIVGSVAPWVVRGFAVKMRDEDEDSEESDARGGAAHGAAGRAPAHGAGSARQGRPAAS